MLKVAIASAGILLSLAPPISAQTPFPKVAQASRPISLCPADLTRTLNPIVSGLSGVNWGVLVQTLDGPTNRKTLYAQNPRALLIPASNNKIFTTAAALQRLGAQYQVRTVVTGNSSGPNLSILRIIGQGDPSLTTPQLITLAQQVRQRGISQVALLIGDDTYFQGAATNPNWEFDDTLQGYGAPVNSLMLNQNGIGVTLFPQRVGQPLRVQLDDPSDAQDWRLDNRSVTVAASQSEFVDVSRDRSARVVYIKGQLRAGSEPELAAASISNPGNYLVQKFRSALTAAGISVAQSTLVRSTPPPPGEVELASLSSPPLSTWIDETNQESNNIYAEALLKTLGRVQNSTNLESTASGTAAVKTILAALGVDSSQFNMVDGSGLARQNRASAEALVQTLQAIALSPDANIFRNSLPVGGVSGTLKNRFRNTPAEGRVQAKTGTISGVVALSGYVTPVNHPPVVFSILTNVSGSPSGNVRSAVDQVVVALARLRQC